MNILHNTKLWLLIIAVMHTVMGGGGTYATYGMDSLAIVGFFCMVGLYLFYAALMVEGQAQARWAAVLCGPVVVWFVLCSLMGLTMFGDPAAPMPESILPIVLWGMPALSGVMGWNMEESTTSASAEA